MGIAGCTGCKGQRPAALLQRLCRAYERSIAVHRGARCNASLSRFLWTLSMRELMSSASNVAVQLQAPGRVHMCVHQYPAASPGSPDAARSLARFTCLAGLVGVTLATVAQVPVSRCPASHRDTLFIIYLQPQKAFVQKAFVQKAFVHHLLPADLPFAHLPFQRPLEPSGGHPA
jgi:hypothetical protein